MKQIAPEVEILDISSDEEPGLAADDYDWLSRLLETDDNKGNSKAVRPPEDNRSSVDDNDDDDDVVVVAELNNPRTPGRAKKSTPQITDKPSTESVNIVDDDDDDDGDCVILDDDPDKPKAVIKDDDAADCDSDSDDLVVVSQKGQIACMDYPHPRHDCAKFVFSSTPHERYCEQCHCYVCDSLAPCIHWGTGVSKFDHCHATDKEEIWRAKRKNFKLMKDGSPQLLQHPHISHSIKSLSHVVGNLGPPTLMQPAEFSRLTAVCQNQISMFQNQISRAATHFPPNQIPRPTAISPIQISRPTGGIAIPQNQISRPTIIRPCSSTTNQSMPNTSFHNKSQQPAHGMTQNGLHRSHPSLGVRSHAINKDRVDNLVKMGTQQYTYLRRPGIIRSTSPSNQYVPHNRGRHGLQYSRSVTRPIIPNSNRGWMSDSPNTNTSNLYQTSHPNMSSSVEPRFFSQPVPQPNNIPNLHLRNADENFPDPELTAYFNQFEIPVKSNQQPPVENFQPQDTVPRNESLPPSNASGKLPSVETELERWLLEDTSHSDGPVTSELNNLPPGFPPDLLSFDVESEWKSVSVTRL